MRKFILSYTVYSKNNNDTNEVRFFSSPGCSVCNIEDAKILESVELLDAIRELVKRNHNPKKLVGYKDTHIREVYYNAVK